MLSSCVTLGKPFRLSGPWFLIWKMKSVIVPLAPGTGLAHSKHYTGVNTCVKVAARTPVPTLHLRPHRLHDMLIFSVHCGSPPLRQGPLVCSPTCRVEQSPP